MGLKDVWNSISAEGQIVSRGPEAGNARLMSNIIGSVAWLESSLQWIWDKEEIFVGMAGEVD